MEQTISKQRSHQIKHPEREKARALVTYKVRTGKIPPARELQCKDCGSQAKEYDHCRGYYENPEYVEPVCKKCHLLREISRKDFDRIILMMNNKKSPLTQ